MRAIGIQATQKTQQLQHEHQLTQRRAQKQAQRTTERNQATQDFQAPPLQEQRPKLEEKRKSRLNQHLKRQETGTQWQTLTQPKQKHSWHLMTTQLNELPC